MIAKQFSLGKLGSTQMHPLLSRVFFVGLIMMSLLVYIWHLKMDKLNQLAHENNQLSFQPVAVLQSAITPYNFAAKIQLVEKTPLKKIELALLNPEDDNVDESLVILDRVVVIPEKLHPRKRSHLVGFG